LAAERILALKAETWLSIDSLEKAVKQRQDHPSGHYLLAIAYWEAKQYQKAVETLQTALEYNFNISRFRGVPRILRETLALMLNHLEYQQQLEKLLPSQNLNWEKMTNPQLRLVLMWETDANNVDLYVYSDQIYHGQRRLPRGRKWYIDIRTGYGPECFCIPPELKAFPYKIEARYSNMGSMGYGMGVVHVLHYDLKTGLKSEFRPFVVMKNRAFVELGVVNKP